MNSTRFAQSCRASLVVLAALSLVSGCAKPNKVNIELRKQNQDLRSQLDTLQRQRAADVATIQSLESQHATTVPTLPSERVSQLFTAAGLKFGRLTGPDPDKPGEALKVYVVPIDAAGEPLKAAGSFVVDAFDLAAPDHPRIGHWEFPLEQAPKNWFGKGLLYTYVLPLPLETRPAHPDITLKVGFTDALTQRSFTSQKVVRLPEAK